MTKPGSLQTEKGTQSILSGGAVAKKVSTPTVESDPGESIWADVFFNGRG